MCFKKLCFSSVCGTGIALRMNQARWPLGDSQALLTQSTHLQNENKMTRIVGLDVSKSSVSCCLRKFQKALGVAPSQESSGDIAKSKVSGGSALCRRALWQWVFSAVEPVKRRTNPILVNLGVFVDAEKSAGKPVKLVRMRVAVKAVKLLFKELVLSKND